ncbi:hypothetical protein EDC04DRAFT_2611675 [Pisolithus marmoratus]|nr:hypothetical protein EDC04DRAFT_2611675 [Pisolithus marmoratus]
MHQAFPICRERSKQHLLQPAVANFFHPRGCDAPHEVEQDDPAQAAELAIPSMMSQLRSSTGSGTGSLQAGNLPLEMVSNSPLSSRAAAKEPLVPSLGACAPAPPSIVSVVVAAPTETSQLGQADLAIRNVTVADLYIHQNDRESVRQIWMWTGHQWNTVKPDCTHPVMSEYRLKILDKGEPSWVMRKTMVSDQGRAKWKSER